MFIVTLIPQNIFVEILPSFQKIDYWKQRTTDVLKWSKTICEKLVVTHMVNKLVFCYLWNQKVHSCVNKSLTLSPVTVQFTPLTLQFISVLSCGLPVGHLPRIFSYVLCLGLQMVS
jgi:hypothetical protein